MANPNAVYQLAREVFDARNGGRTPASLRLQVKQAIRGTNATGGRGPLRMALIQAKHARDSFKHGETALAAQQLLLARYWMDKAEITSAALLVAKNSAAKRTSAQVPRKVTPEIEKAILRIYASKDGGWGAVNHVVDQIERKYQTRLTRQTVATVLKKNHVK